MQVRESTRKSFAKLYSRTRYYPVHLKVANSRLFAMQRYNSRTKYTRTRVYLTVFTALFRSYVAETYPTYYKTLCTKAG